MPTQRRRHTSGRGRGVNETQRRGDTRRTPGQRADLEQVKGARIRVGAPRAPRLEPLGDLEQSGIGRLFDALGDFADGPFSQALRDRHDASTKQAAEQAVLEGQLLDDVDPEDRNALFDYYYRGARGRARGAELLGEIRQVWDANADDPSFDHTGAAQEILKSRFEDLDDVSAENAQAVVRERLGTMLDQENERRTNQARIAAYDLRWEAGVQEALGAAEAGDYEYARTTFMAVREDTKALPGEFDADAFNARETNEWMSLLKQFGPSQGWLDAVKKKRPNGSSLWTHPEYGRTLREAWARATTEEDAQDARYKGELRSRVERELEETDTISPESIALLEEVESDDAMATWYKRKTTAEDDYQIALGRFSVLAGNDTDAEAVGVNRHQYAHDMDDQEWNGMLEVARKEFGRGGIPSDETERFISNMEAEIGRMSKGTKDRVVRGLQSTDKATFEEALMAANNFRVHNPSVFAGLPDATRTTVHVVSLFESRGLGVQDYITTKDTIRKDMKAAREDISSNRATMIDTADDYGLKAGDRFEHRDITAYLLATGRFTTVEDAASAAAEELADRRTAVDPEGRIGVIPGLVDPSLGNPKNYERFKVATIERLQDERGLDLPDILVKYGAAEVLGDAPDPRHLDQFMVWPRRDGTTWVMDPDGNLEFVLETAPLLQRMYAMKAKDDAKVLERNVTQAVKDSKETQSTRQRDRELSGGRGAPPLY